jgi:hypothetical protein
VRATLLLSLLLMTLPAGAGAMVSDDPPSGTWLTFGMNYCRVYMHPETAWGYAGTVVFHPDQVAQFSQTLASWNLGLALRYNRTKVEKVATFEGVEIEGRRYFSPIRGGLRPWLGAGLGQQWVEWSGESGGTSRWSWHLSGGIEREFKTRFLGQLGLVNRLIEFSNDSFSGSSLVLTFGMRID